VSPVVLPLARVSHAGRVGERALSVALLVVKA
jgi:hypothetical protein